MSREAQVELCERCSKQVMDINRGIICSLTGGAATFEHECSDFEMSDAEIARLEQEKMIQDLLPERIESLRLEQNMLMGFMAALVVGIAGAILWGVITVAVKVQIGYMAVGIGAAVGISMRYFGKGIDTAFGVTAAIIALFSCLLGNFLGIVGFIALEEGLGYIETLFLINYSYLPQIMAETFHPLDILFYGLAIYTGNKFAFRNLTPELLGIQE